MSAPTDPVRAARVLEIFGEVLDLPPAEREACVGEACGEDTLLRAEICSLLHHLETNTPFLDRPVFVIDPDLVQSAAQGELRAGEPLGDCRIDSLLGEGGMGEVYLASDTVLGRQVAIKVLKHHAGDDVLGQRFRHERRVLAGLTHPNIARLYGSGATAKGRAYLVMEYVEGEPLDRFCDQRGLDLFGRLTLFLKVCAAVSYAHQNLVVHRDLKPANIRVTAEGEPKLLDFGIAKLLDPEGSLTSEGRADPAVTMNGAMTPEYASPEQLKGEAITTASDVYSLGVVLYELLCGQRPYLLKGRRPDELARAICEEEPPRPSVVAGRTDPPPRRLAVPTGLSAVPGESPARRRRRLEGDLDNIAAKALRKEPARRYPSVLALAEDLRRHCEGRPITARRDTLGYRTGKFVRRNKVGAVAAALLLLALAGGLVATTWQTRVAEQERDHARAAQVRAETAQRQAERINGFLQQLLGSASPRKMGKDIKVVQVLDAAGASVDQELAAEPEVLAQIHRTLGETYQGLALPQQAATHFQAEVDLRRRLHGGEDERTILAEISLAHALCLTGLFIEPEPLLRHALATLRRQPAVDEVKEARVLRLLSYCLMEMHRTPEARATMQAALTSAAKAWGENSTGYADMLLQVGTADRYDKKYGAAADIFRRTTAIYERIAPNDPQMVTNELSLCLALLEQHKLAESQAEWDRTMRDCVRLLGNNDNRWHKELVFIAEVLDFARGDDAKVVAEGPEVLAQRTAISPNSDGYVVTARYVLGASLTRMGRAAEGESLLRQALADYDSAAPAFLLGYGNIETALGDCVRTQGRYAEAEPFLLTGYDKLKGDANEQAALSAATKGLHDLYAAWNKPADAARYVGNVPPASSP